jgi:WD40 repeat protein
VRDEFRKRLHFPVVLWVNDEVLHRLVRFAPDFTSWAATPIKFEIATGELIEFLQQRADSLFHTILYGGGGKYAPWRICTHHATLNRATGCRSRLEIDAALKDLQSREEEISPQLEASLQFVFGQYDYASDRINYALDSYRKSLRYWRSTNNLERQGVLLFYWGLCHCRKADLHRAQKRRHWEEGVPYLQQCVEVFRQAERPELMARFIPQLLEMLERLEAWETLQMQARQALNLHQTEGWVMQRAQDYGFLAEVALKQARWEEGRQLAEQALALLSQVSGQPSEHQGLHRLLLRQLYQLFLVTAEGRLARETEAQALLEQASGELQEAIASSDYHYEPERYLHILEGMRSLYFERGKYLEAFRIKQEQRAVEQLYGFRAFIGAGRLQPQHLATNPIEREGIYAREIAASGRQQDVNRLFERMTRADCKLTVIHGQSGVGKSSIVSAGLVPALKYRTLGDRVALPVVMQVYTDWVRELGKAFGESLDSFELRDGDELIDAGFQDIPDAPGKVQTLLAQLRQNAEQNLVTILVFDQFEEFFLGATNQSQRILFYHFLRDCLNQSFVKVIFVLRQDYLHYLLELEQFDLEIINHNILDKSIRYPLGNFELDDARAVIKSLTDRAHFYLEPALIDELVRDLAGELGTVRPIELQVVGAQLQAENITTLAKYREAGPKQRLVERFLEKVVKDCGKENEHAAWLVLHLLTDENDSRPLKTRAELAVESGIEEEQLDLILEILEKSGLVFLLPEVPTNRYQLVHDYLVEFIRQQQQSTAQQELEELRQKHQRSQAKIAQLSAELREQELRAQLAKATAEQRSTEEKLNRVLKRQLREARLVGVTVAVLSVIAGGLGLWAVMGATNTQLSALSASSEVLIASERRFDALINSLRAGKRLKQSFGATPVVRTRAIATLQQAVYGVRERNRLQGHTDWVSSVSFSPDGELIASGSRDETIRLWRRDGALVKSLTGHEGGVHAVSFSPDGQILASTSEDKTVKLWSREGRLLNTLQGHGDRIHSLSFSPDSQLLASASEDGTVKLWSREGRLLNTLQGHGDRVLGVSISPQGDLIASASRDETIRLWTKDGTLLESWNAHPQAILSISFSPDGERLASASADNTVKLWRTDGTLVTTLEGHSDWVLDVAFSPDGEKIATASKDNTIKLWGTDGALMETFKGHGKMVEGLSFSPDSDTLASASADNTIRLWRSDGGMLEPIRGHSEPVSSVSFSPDGTIATASWDNTIKLWRPDGVLLKAILAHREPVSSVSFSPNGKLIASGSWDKTVKLWQRDGRLRETLKGHRERVTSASFSPNNRLIVSSSEDRTVKLWRTDGTLLQTLSGHQAEVWSASFSPDGRTVASASGDGTVKLWRTNGELIATLQEHVSSVNWVAFSPDGKLIASASADGTVNLWRKSGDTVKYLKSLKGHNGSVNWVSFSPDGKLIASASSDETVNLWSREGNLISTLEGHEDAVFGVSFSADGQLIASASKDETAIVWNLDLEDLLDRSCTWLGDYLENNLERPSDRALCEGIEGR